MKTADVVAVDRVHVVAICPFCGKFHWHGSNRLINELDYGSRVPHCTGEDANLSGSEQYELVASSRTIRKEALKRGDLRAWLPEQKRRRAAILEQRRELDAAEVDRRIWAAIREIRERRGWLKRWNIASTADVSDQSVTLWLRQHGIRFVEGRYQVIQEHKAGPELTAIFGRAM